MHAELNRYKQKDLRRETVGSLGSTMDHSSCDGSD